MVSVLLPPGFNIRNSNYQNLSGEKPRRVQNRNISLFLENLNVNRRSLPQSVIASRVKCVLRYGL